MKQITINTYKFNELNEEARENALRKLRDINAETFNDDYFLYDFLQEVKEKTGLDLEKSSVVWEVGGRGDKFGVKKEDISRTLSYKFDGLIEDVELPEKVGVFLNHLGGGICRLGKTEKDLAVAYFVEDIDKLKQGLIQREVFKIVNSIIDLCEKHYTQLNEDYFYQFSDEAVKETIEANEYDFDENGSLI